MPQLSALDSKIFAKQGVSGAARGDVQAAIQLASARTGVDFSYMMEKAAAESSFNPNAKARTSSATGLYQFIDSTWLQMVKQHGHKYGLGEMADKINQQGGRYRVSDAATRREILELRKDPEIAALMAGEFAKGNKEHLQRAVGGEIGSTELYFAHFLGAGGAAKFLNAMQKNPEQSAANIMPEAARANRNVFYEKNGRPRTLAEVYDFFGRKFGDSAVAFAAADHSRAPVASNKIMAQMAELGNRIAAQPHDQAVSPIVSRNIAEMREAVEKVGAETMLMLSSFTTALDRPTRQKEDDSAPQLNARDLLNKLGVKI